MLANPHSWLLQPQSKLGPIGLLVLLVITGLVTPLSMDMYLPSIPHMAEYFNTTEGVVNFTLVGFFLFFALGLLIFGPLSDKYGRKVILLLGMVVYTLASAACALAPTIEMLIAMRIFQALAAGAMGAVSTAIIKDAIAPDKRELVLSIMQVMFVVGPVVAPVVGAVIVQYADWRMTFWILVFAGLVCTTMTLLFDETLPQKERNEGSIAHSFIQLGVVARNKGFSLFLLICALFGLPFMAYISVSSYVYINFFSLSELEFSYFFAAVALISTSGPFIWLAASKFISARRFTTIMIVLALTMGIAMIAVGGLSPFLFFFTFLIFAITESCIRPYSTNILLSQKDQDAGAASSLINFTHTAIGCIGMALAVLPWPNYVFGIGAIIVITTLATLALWVFLLRSSIPLKGIKDVDPRIPAAVIRQQQHREAGQGSDKAPQKVPSPAISETEN